MKQVVIPLYVANEGEAVAVVTVEQTCTDYQRKAFMKIGLLPKLVLEGVTIEVRDPDKTAQALACLNDWLNPRKAGKLVDFRKVTIILDKKSAKILTATSVHFAADGRWDLQTVHYQYGQQRISAECGSLQVIGNRAGDLILGDSAPLNLFGSSETAKTAVPVEACQMNP